MHFARSLVVLVLAVAVLATPVRRDAAKVESDIEDVTASMESLDNSVIAFPDNDGTFDQAWDIHKDALALAELVQTATKDAEAAESLTNMDSDTLLGLARIIVSTTRALTTRFIAKKAVLGQVPGAMTLARKDLGTLQTNTQGFESALMAIVPKDSAAAYQELLGQINQALSEVSNAYSS